MSALDLLTAAQRAELEQVRRVMLEHPQDIEREKPEAETCPQKS